MNVFPRYGEVFWTMSDPIPLDPDLVARFKDKTMAVVGYETDQVQSMIFDHSKVSPQSIIFLTYRFSKLQMEMCLFQLLGLTIIIIVLGFQAAILK